MNKKDFEFIFARIVALIKHISICKNWHNIFLFAVVLTFLCSCEKLPVFNVIAQKEYRSEDFSIGPPLALEKIKSVGSVYGTIVVAEGRQIVHQGIDIVADEGIPFIAVCPGTVVRLEERSMSESKLQINVNLKYNSEYTVLYAFEPVKEITVSLFEPVEKGSIIGYLGAHYPGGYGHVHFALIRNGDWACPTPYLVTDVRKKLNEVYHGAGSVRDPPNICNCPEHQVYFE